MNSPLLQWIRVYVSWLGLTALALWLVFLLQYNLVNNLFFMHVNAWQLRFVHQWSIFVLGTIWILYVFLTEGYLRRGLHQGKLLGHMFRAGIPVAVLIALSWLIRLMP